MKICVVQIRPVPRNIKRNIENHKNLIEMALTQGANMIIFPELSLTGYEPELAEDLAMSIEDKRLDIFQKISDNNKLTIGIGVPTIHNSGICISMIIFQADRPLQVYSKKYLHEDEEPWFSPGKNANDLIGDTHIAPAICFEISIPEHAENASRTGAEIYIASVAKSLRGVNIAIERLTHIAKDYSMTVLMANCIGPCEGESYECAGRSSVISDKGELLGQLKKVIEGFLIIDTVNSELIKIEI